MNKIPVVSSVRPGALYVIRPKTICLIGLGRNQDQVVIENEYCYEKLLQKQCSTAHSRKNVLICLHVFDIDRKSGSMVMKV